MRVYVTYYGPKPLSPDKDETPTEREERLAGPSVIRVSATPEWTIPTKEMADVELMIVRRAGYHFGFHFCDFEVTELLDGTFAISCPDHHSTDISG